MNVYQALTEFCWC